MQQKEISFTELTHSTNQYMDYREISLPFPWFPPFDTRLGYGGNDY